MTRQTPLFLLILFLAASAFGQSALLEGTASAATFNYGQANLLALSIASLDKGSTKIVDQGQGNPAKVVEGIPFDFSVKTKLALAYDLSALKTALDAYQKKGQDNLSTALKNAGVTDVKLLSQAQKDAVDAADAAMSAEQVDVDLRTITVEDLNLGVNKGIPNTVISALDRIRGDLKPLPR